MRFYFAFISFSNNAIKLLTSNLYIYYNIKRFGKASIKVYDRVAMHLAARHYIYRQNTALEAPVYISLMIGAKSPTYYNYILHKPNIITQSLKYR